MRTLEAGSTDSFKRYIADLNAVQPQRYPLPTRQGEFY
jgi:hypothetical protein